MSVRRMLRTWAGLSAALSLAGVCACTAAAARTVAAPGERAGRGAAVVYVLNTGSGTVTPISAATRKAGKPISAGPFASGDLLRGIAVSPNGRTILVTGTKAVIPITAGARKPGRPISVSGPPRTITFGPRGRTAWVVANLSKLVPIHVATRHAGRPISLSAAVVEADRIAITRSGQRAFVAGDFRLVPVDLAKRKVGRPISYRASGVISGTEQVELGGSHTVWAMVIGSRLLRVQTGSPRTVRRIKLHPLQITVTPDGRTVFARTARGVVPVNAATGRPGKLIRFSQAPENLVVAPDGRTLYVAAGRAIVPVAVATGKRGRPLQLARRHYRLRALAISPDGRTLWTSWERLAGDGTGFVTPVSLPGMKAGAPIRVGIDPSCIVVAVPGSTRPADPASCNLSF